MKHEIEIPDLPEGYRALEYRSPSSSEDLVLTSSGIEKAGRVNRAYPWLIVEKIKPRRRVFECVSETPRKAVKGEWKLNGTDLTLTECDETKFEYPIWREVTEKS